jgi:acyl-CoA synthetase (AMP-forming)/AMP-acid ligase II
MPQPVIERAMKLLPDTDFTNAYGLTETSSTISLLGPEDHRAAAASDDPEIRRRLTSVGRPLPTLEVQVRDEAGRPLAPGQRGEIYVRGEQVSGETSAAQHRRREGWFPRPALVDGCGLLFLEAARRRHRRGGRMSPGEIATCRRWRTPRWSVPDPRRGGGRRVVIAGAEL